MQILFNSYFGFVVSGYLPTESNITNTFAYGKFNNIGSKPVPNPALSLPITVANPVDLENLANESAAEKVLSPIIK